MTFMPTKKKVSVTIDEDLIQHLEASDENLSSQVNEAIRQVIETRRRNQALGVWLDELDGRHGPVDETLIEHYMDLLT
jgi:post-segregation antitoxin (ccd killing protein)